MLCHPICNWLYQYWHVDDMSIISTYLDQYRRINIISIISTYQWVTSTHAYVTWLIHMWTHSYVTWRSHIAHRYVCYYCNTLQHAATHCNTLPKQSHRAQVCLLLHLNHVNISMSHVISLKCRHDSVATANTPVHVRTHICTPICTHIHMHTHGCCGTDTNGQ